MKLPNGFGTVYKLSGNRRKSWVARITVGWTTTIAKKGRYAGQEVSKQLYQTIGCFEEKNQALDALTKFRINPVSPKANITLKELYDEWSKSKYEYLSQSTVDNYKGGWKDLSRYGSTQFKEIRTAHIQSIIDGKHKAGSSRSKLAKIKIVANMLYEYAMQNDIVNKNYAEFIRLPKEEREAKEIFSDLEIKALEKYGDNIEWVDTVLIMIYSGMRISEMLQLTKFNIDLEKGIITGGIKTEAGKNRIIPIHPKIYKYIKKWYDRNGSTLICKSTGEKMSSNYYRREYYYAALEAAEVRKLTPHACRHTFASLMSKAGANTKAIQDIMGHEDYALTANVYTHTDIEELQKAISLI